MSCNLKMVLLIYNISINDEVMALFEGSDAPCFTQWPRVVGKGVTTGPKMDNDVWPGANSAIMTILPEDRAKKLFDDVQAIRNEIGQHEGVKAFILPIEAMTGDI